MRHRMPAEALRPLLILHGFRFVGLSFMIPGVVAPDLPPVWVDATLIVQVFTNLLDNIAKYTPAGTRVTISAAAEPDRSFVGVTVDDEGPGLPPGDPARLRQGRGAGLVPAAAAAHARD